MLLPEAFEISWRQIKTSFDSLLTQEYNAMIKAMLTSFGTFYFLLDKNIPYFNAAAMNFIFSISKIKQKTEKGDNLCFSAGRYTVTGLSYVAWCPFLAASPSNFLSA